MKAAVVTEAGKIPVYGEFERPAAKGMAQKELRMRIQRRRIPVFGDVSRVLMQDCYHEQNTGILHYVQDDPR